MADQKETKPADAGTTQVTTVQLPDASFPGDKTVEEQPAATPVEKRDDVPVEAKRAARKHPTCPQCDRELDVYLGTNEHKQGTGTCPVHGRQPITVS